MKIAVVGPGAIGCLYGALLSANPANQVWLIGREGGASMRTLQVISRSGIHVSGGTEGVYRNVRVHTNPVDVGVCDIVLLTTKTYSTREAAKASKPLVGGDTVFVILQNGLGQEKDVLEFIPGERVVRGITMNGVLPIEPGKIMHAGKGETIIGGLIEGQDKLLVKVKECFEDANLPTRISQDIQADVWLKTLVNAGINTVGALYKRTNGEIYDDSKTKTLCERAVSEGMEVATALGVSLPQDALAKTQAVSKATYSNKNSMWMDVEQGRKTEIDAINSYIAGKGGELGIPTPINELLAKRINEL